jgi:hypothetical protein
MGNRWYAELSTLDRLLLFNFDADYYKLRAHELLRTEQGRSGSLEFCTTDSPNEHTKLWHHLCNEQFRTEWVPGKGLVGAWHKTGQNHLLDCLAMCLAQLDYVGFRLPDVSDAVTDTGDTGEATAEELPSDAPDNWYARMLCVQ